MAFLERNANRGSISTGYDIDHSMKVQANSGNEWFYRDNPSEGNRRTFTFSFWIKRTQLSGYEADNYLMGQGSNARFHFASHTLRFMFDGNSTELEASGKLRDTSAWYHIVLAVDTTQGTDTNRVKMYVNGEDYPFNNSDWPSQNAQSDWMNTNDLYFNTKYAGDGSYDNSGYWAEIAVVDGQQLAATDFGEFDEDSGIWKPKDLSSITWGSEGFWWNFSNSSSLGEDSSGNSNTATFNNLTTADLATDTPTNNFATLNPLHNYFNETSKFVITEGGTKVTGSSASTSWRGVPSTFAVSSGKWYFELSGSGSYILIGAGSADTGQTEWAELTSIANPSTKAKMMYSYNGGVYGYNSSTDAWQYGFGFGHGTAYNVGVAVDLDNGHMYFSKDGAAYTDSGDPTSGSTGTGAIDLPWYDTESTVFIVTVANSGSTSLLNFGGYTTGTISSAASDANGYGTFEYAPPSGYYALCTKNLAEYG